MKNIYTILFLISLSLSVSAQPEECNDPEEGLAKDTKEVVSHIYNKQQTSNLFAAIKAKNLKAVKAALAKNANPNFLLVEKPNLTALSYAVEYGTPEILRAILVAGGDPNATDLNAKATTPLIQAARDNKTEFIDVLLDPGFSTDINKTAAGGRSPLHFAATNHSVGAITRLVKDPNINLNVKSVFVVGKGDTPLSSLCVYGVIKGIHALLNHPTTTKPVELDNLLAAESSLNADIAVEGKKAIQAYKAKYYP